MVDGSTRRCRGPAAEKLRFEQFDRARAAVGRQELGVVLMLGLQGQRGLQAGHAQPQRQEREHADEDAFWRWAEGRRLMHGYGEWQETLASSGFDVQASANTNATSVGRFNVSYRGTYIHKYRFQVEPGGTWHDPVGNWNNLRR